MWRWMPLAGLGVVGLVLWGALVISLRTKFHPVLDRVRRLNRALWNPLSMKSAGSVDADASIVRHVGRQSGGGYETPVGVVITEDGLVIGLPYGTKPDWVKNCSPPGRPW
jgi:hypothetical protein